MSMVLPALLFGVQRSPVNSLEKFKVLIDPWQKYTHLRLEGIMGYEAQIAGLGDIDPSQGIKNRIIPFLKKMSIRELANRRAACVNYAISKGHVVSLVNGGGTGSLESTREEDCVTEVTVGSGFYSPALFDFYSTFKHLPAAGYALEIVRKPSKNVYTCLGGGYIASGSISPNKQPVPYLPEGAKLTTNEGTGEVQTPVEYTGKEKLKIGDTILLRHSKAGELCERFNDLCLVSKGHIISSVPTYRGMGKCFL
jgi:D-serine deaminase-like pyridoxal phosphate-dependent protein